MKSINEVLNIDSITNECIRENEIKKLIDSDFIPSFDEFTLFPNLRNRKLLFRTFKEDKRVVAFFNKKDTEDLEYELYFNDYVPDEFALISNPILGNSLYLMSAAIKKNPQLIKYVSKDLFLNPADVKSALYKYMITIDDLKKHPELCQNDLIMNTLDKIDSKFRLYHLSSHEKKKLLMKQLTTDTNTISEFPFMKEPFNTVSSDLLNEFIKFIYHPINEEDIDDQQVYYTLLDKIIDASVNIRYLNSKKDFLYNNIAVIGTKVSKVLNETSSKEEFVTSLSEEFYMFINTINDEIVSFSEISNYFNIIYDSYSEDGNLFKDSITEIYNSLLNLHSNAYKANEKSNIKREIKNKLKLSPKKASKVILDKKINYVSKLLKEKNYSSLGYSLDELKQIIKSERSYIRNIKKIRKNNIDINDDDFLKLEEKVISDSLDRKTIQELLNINDKKIIDSIYKRYNRIKYLINDKLDLKDEFTIEDADKEKFDFNYNNFLIASNDNYNDVVCDYLIKLDSNIISDILNNQSNCKELLSLVPLANLVDEFSSKDIISIMGTYNVIINHLLNKSNMSFYQANPLRFISKNLDYVIRLNDSLSKDYSINEEILGKDVVNKLRDDLIPSYANTYISMINKSSSIIPPVIGEFKDYKFESDNNYDVSRLLIGKIFGDSCIDINNYAGEDTFKKCLTEKDGDVILLKDKYTNDVVGRSLVFRLGNTILLSNFISTTGNILSDVYDEEFLDNIATQIMDASTSSGDNIENILLIADAFNDPDDLRYKTITDKRLFFKFPHADLTDKAFVICSKNMDSNGNINAQDIKLDDSSQSSYKSRRKEIRSIKDVIPEEITRIKALNSLFRQEKDKNSHKFMADDYKELYYGEDWYIGVSNDDIYEEIVLPTTDNRKFEEIENVKKLLNDKVQNKQL